MNRTVSLAAMLFGLQMQPAFAERRRASPPSIKEAQFIRLEQPATFYRDGALVEATELVQLRVAVEDPMESMPRAIPSPVYLYGHALCEFLDPSGSERELLLLCPKPPAGEPVVLWKVRAEPSALSKERTEALLKGRLAAELTAAVKDQAGAPTKSYLDANSLRSALKKKGKKGQ
jgi:hypothetical protein